MAALVRYQRRANIAQCPIHEEIFNTAKYLFSLRPYFSKAEIMKSLKYAIVPEAIDWDDIRDRFRKQDDRMDLVPLVKAYFDQHDKQLELLYTSRYIAIGRGKQTYGYGACVDANGHLFLRYADHKGSVANGVNKALREYTDGVGTRLGPNYQYELDKVIQKVLPNGEF